MSLYKNRHRNHCQHREIPHKWRK